MDGAEAEFRPGVLLEVGEQVRLARPGAADEEVQAAAPLGDTPREPPELGVLVLPSDRRLTRRVHGVRRRDASARCPVGDKERRPATGRLGALAVRRRPLGQ